MWKSVCLQPGIQWRLADIFTAIKLKSWQAAEGHCNRSETGVFSGI